MTAATRYGATGEIAQVIGDVLAQRVSPPSSPPRVTCLASTEYDAVVLGSAVYTGHWLEPAKALVHRSAGALATRPVWLFSSGPVGKPSRKLVQKMGQDPADLSDLLAATHAREHRMFAGTIEKKHLSLPQRTALTAFRPRGSRLGKGVADLGAGLAARLKPAACGSSRKQAHRLRRSGGVPRTVR